MSGRAAAWLAWSLFAAFVALLVATGVLTAFAPPPPPGIEPFSAGAGFFAVAMFGFMGVGALLASRLPANPLGWILCGFALLMVINPLTYVYAIARLPGETVSAWLSSWLWVPPIALLGLALLLFPNGHLPSRRWRWVVWAVGAGIGLSVVVGVALWPARGLGLLAVGDAYPGLAGSLSNLALPLVFGSFVASAVSLILRFRQARGDERLQLKWLVYATTVAAIGLVAFAVGDVALGGMQPIVAEVLSSVGVLGIPLAVGIAIMKYRLYEIDRIISRTVSYASLTALLAAVYAAAVLLLGPLLRPLGAGSDLAVAGSTLAVAAAFGPARRRVQAAVDRRFNRARYDAARTVEAFSARLREEVDIDELSADLVAVVGRTVQPVRVLLWLRASQLRR